MKVLNYVEYCQRENKFFEKHHVTNVVEGGTISQRYKHYICEDGAELYEDIRVETMVERVVVNTKYGEMTTNVEIKVLVTEVWDTDDSSSAYYVERY